MVAKATGVSWSLTTIYLKSILGLETSKASKNSGQK
jgi:hypothetical protein